MSAFLEKVPDMSRRTFLVGSVGSALVMAFAGVAPAGCSRTTLEQRKFSPTLWFEIDESGKTTIIITKAEMGQHVGTALARIVADELGAAWADVAIKRVDSDPKWGFFDLITGGSWSVVLNYTSLSQAGAAGRTVLLDAGAKLLGADPADCIAQDSKVQTGDRSVSYADIVRKGEIDRQFSAAELAAMPVKETSAHTLVGRDVHALDIPEKTSGSAIYGIDAERPGMVYARPVMPPTRYGSSVNSVDDTAAANIEGYIGYEVITDPGGLLQGWVVAVAESYPAAIKAADVIKVDWTKGPTAEVSEQEILAEGDRLASDKNAGSIFVNEGDVDAAAQEAVSTHSARYRTSTALHFPLEPMNALAELVGDTWHIHSGNQAQSINLPLLAASLGVPQDKIIMHTYYLGGGFGRRLYGDYMLPAALTARQIGRPVKCIFTRADDSRFDCVRSPSVQRLEATFDTDMNLTGIDHAAAAGWPSKDMLPPFLGDGINDSGKFDPFSINGSDHWYTLANHRVRALNNDLAQRTFLPGYLRSVSPGWTGWAVESFIDELANITGTDPIEYRLAMLDGSGKNAGEAPRSVGGAKRIAAVLESVRDRSGWGRQLPEDEGMGVAVCGGQERDKPTWIACVAHVKVDRVTGDVKVLQMTLDVDCGIVVHPDGALAQVEGATLWGVSLALHEGTQFKNGQVADTNLDTYTPLRMQDVPELDIAFAKSSEYPTGLGEPAVIVAGPAIANAIFQAAGVRVRDLPIKAEDILSGLAARA